MKTTLLLLLVAAMLGMGASAQDTGLQSPSSNQNSNGVTNPQYAYASDNQYAVFNSSSDRVDYGGFNFSGIPSGANILGILVNVEGNQTFWRYADVSLSWNNSSGFTSTQQISSFTGSDAVYTVGGAADTWGRGWTVAELATTAFRVRLQASGIYGNLNIDHVRVQVFYSVTVPLTPPPQAVFESLAAGSLIIPMNDLDVGQGQDNENERGQQSQIKVAYGLVYTLLANSVPVRWAFSTTKTHNGADFLAAANQVVRRRGDTTITSSFNYKGSAFIIQVQDTAVAGPILRNSTFSRVTVHQVLTAFGTTVPVVYTLTQIPMALIFDNTSNQLPALEHIFTEASIPTSAYTATTTFPNLSTPTCYTIAMLPHDEGITTSQVNSLHSFLIDGGNLYVQCAAIDEFENVSGVSSTYGRTFTTMSPAGGVARSTTSDGNNYIYPDTGAILSYGQFVGDIEQSGNSHTPYWRLSSGSRYRDGFIDVARTNSNFNVSNLYQKISAKRFDNDPYFGWVFYCGGHNHSNVSSGGVSGGNYEKLPRLLLNAFLTPASRSSCSPLPVQLVSFTASTSGNGVRLRWKTVTEVNNYGFEILRSSDQMQSWVSVGFIPGGGTSNVPLSYSFDDINAKDAGSKLLYKLKQVDRDGTVEYSNTIVVEFTAASRQPAILGAYPNPFTRPATVLRFGLPAATRVTLTVQDMLGREVLSLLNDEEQNAGEHSITVNMGSLPAGTYIALLKTAGAVSTFKITLQQ